ncbi:MAG: prepilin peptidase [Gammaproteobacteria bacterium]|nr:MAG: prepilin peptidase [Gammaproteobacteria bacterium]
MDVLLLLQTSPPLLYVTAGILGLMVGSFLNVVIHRLPIILERQWSRQCHEHLEIDPGASADEPPFNLVRPASRCPECGHRIRALENIPVVSYLFLKGQCASCGTRIPVRYPAIELVTAMASVMTVVHFGFGIQAAAALLFAWTIIPLCMIDYDYQLLPDSITLPLLWAGLALSLWGVFVDSHSSIIGAIAGYLSLWLVFHLFRLATGKEGMGFGDFKLLAAIGAWTGWQALPVVILFSSVVGAVTGILLILLKGHDRNQPLPFGPFLAIAGWITLLWGQDIMHFYLQ